MRDDVAGDTRVVQFVRRQHILLSHDTVARVMRERVVAHEHVTRSHEQDAVVVLSERALLDDETRTNDMQRLTGEHELDVPEEAPSDARLRRVEHGAAARAYHDAF